MRAYALILARISYTGVVYDDTSSGKTKKLRFSCVIDRPAISLLEMVLSKQVFVMHEITELLQAWTSGDKEALERLMPLVDPDLKKLAHNYMRKERPGNVLQTTALVNEALIRLMQEKVKPEDRNQFYGFAAKRMRQVLIDYAKKQQAARRGNRPQQVDVAEVEELSEEKSQELVRLEEALVDLATEDERQVAIVEYRFFIGLSIEETASVMGLSPRTVMREWQAARAWLNLYMTT